MSMDEQRKAVKRAKVKADRDRDNREMSALKAAAGLTYPHGRVDAKVAAARLAEIPPDRRNLTQRICGDPLFERSALYKMRSEPT